MTISRDTHTTVEPINELDTGRGARLITVAVRVLVALMWLQNVQWKKPPDFGQDGGNGLYGWSNRAIENPVFPPFSWAVENLIFPNFLLFGWVVLLLEFSLGAFLLAGFLTRLWAVLGILQSIAITLSVLNTEHEWQWSYYLMIAAHAMLFATAAGRAYGVDGLLRPRWSASSRRLARLAMRLS